ncbi:MAG: anhydro-N-acetylmuramic acid kinase [Methylophilales bacterium]|nr:anhydro-N-acetylmuramic acid kinase [Methylophilales bacterium]
MHNMLFIGLMSGTSLDGVDVALVEFNSNDSTASGQVRLLNTHFLAYPASLRAKILALQYPTANELETTALMGNTLAKLYAEAINQLLAKINLKPQQITAIGCHGQTIRHQPQLIDGIGFTMQIGNPALLAELTGITVVADFRSRDIAAGGQGAPLVPAFHQAMFASSKMSRAIINIGGIANITFLKNNNVLGFDSGPGNMLLDAWIKQHQNLDYDANGGWASTGHVIAPLLEAMLADPYFALSPPKSTGRDLFNDQWLSKKISGQHYAAQDVARTLVALTAHTIVDSLQHYCGSVDEVYLCGGGAHNSLLRSSLQTLLADVRVESTDILGVGVDWLEAIAFAWLAKQTLDKKTANLPEVTGAKGARILGAIYQN